MPDQQLIQEGNALLLSTLKEPLFADRSPSPTLARILADIAGEKIREHLDGELYDYRSVETHPTQASSYVRLGDGTIWAVSIVKQR